MKVVAIRQLALLAVALAIHRGTEIKTGLDQVARAVVGARGRIWVGSITPIKVLLFLKSEVGRRTGQTSKLVGDFYGVGTDGGRLDIRNGELALSRTIYHNSIEKPLI